MPAPTQVSIKLVKSFPYRGTTREWSNRYFFTDGAYSGLAEFEVFADAMVALEKQIFSPASTLIEAVGYNPGSEIPVYTKTYSVAGTSVPGSAHSAAPGDAAAMWRFSTDARSTRNHPIYLYKWLHSVWIDESVSPDTLHGDQHTGMGVIANAMIAGVSDGTNTRVLCSPRGAVAQSVVVDTHIRHRDFRT